MKKEDFQVYKKHLSSLSDKDKKKRDLYLKNMSNGNILGAPIGIPSLDKVWLRNYSDEQILSDLPNNISVFEYLKQHNKNNMNKLALTYFIGEKEINKTYAELFQVIDETAKSLVAIGIKEDEVVCIDLPACPEEMYLLYAIDKIGATANFIIPNVPDGRICDILNEFNCKKLFISLYFKNNFDILFENSNVDTIIEVSIINQKINIPNVISWETFMKLGLEQKLDETYIRNAKKNLFIAKTGGTLSEPKSVDLCDEGFNNMVQQLIDSPLQFDSGDSWLRLWPIFSATAAVAGSHLPLCCGMNLIIYPLQDINKIDEIIVRFNPNHTMITPAILDILIESPLMKNKKLTNIKTIGCGGAGLTKNFEYKTKEFCKEHGITCYLGHAYGMTENTTTATNRVNDTTAKVGSVGIPLVKTTIGIFNPETYEELYYGEIGEVCIQSPNFMLGYHNNDKLTNSVLINHGNGDIWLHSGDLGYMDEEGVIYIVDRIKSVIYIFPSDKIFPKDIDDVVQSVEGVELVITVAEPDWEHNGFYFPVCFIKIKEDYVDKDVFNRVYNLCMDKLPKFSIPKSLYKCDEIPLSSMGKPNIVELKKRAVLYSGTVVKSEA